MKKTFRFMALTGMTILLLALIGCATARIDVPADMKDTVLYENGNPILESRKINSVLLSFSTISFNREQNAAFLILVKNNSAKPFNFSPKNVIATLDGRPLEVYTYAALRKKIKKKAAWMAFAAALNGMSASMAAAQPKTTTSFGSTSSYGNFNTYGSNNLYGSYSSYGTYNGSSTTYDPASTAKAQAAINANTSRQIATIVQDRNSQIKGLNSLLRRTTVLPGEVRGGIVQIKAPLASSKPKSLIIKVSTPDDEHTFHLVYMSK